MDKQFLNILARIKTELENKDNQLIQSAESVNRNFLPEHKQLDQNNFFDWVSREDFEKFSPLFNLKNVPNLELQCFQHALGFFRPFLCVFSHELIRKMHSTKNKNWILVRSTQENHGYFDHFAPQNHSESNDLDLTTTFFEQLMVENLGQILTKYARKLVHNDHENAFEPFFAPQIDQSNTKTPFEELQFQLHSHIIHTTQCLLNAPEDFCSFPTHDLHKKHPYHSDAFHALRWLDHTNFSIATILGPLFGFATKDLIDMNYNNRVHFRRRIAAIWYVHLCLYRIASLFGAYTITDARIRNLERGKICEIKRTL